MKKIFIYILAFFYVVLVPAAGEKIITSATGPSKREALLSAQRKAVEQGVGVMVEANSMAENMVLLEDKIYSRSRGYVKKYTLLSEKKQRDGSWKVTIESEVAVGRIKDSLDAIGILRDKMGNPRFMILYDHTAAGEIPPKHSRVVTEAYEGISQHLTEREYPLVAPGTLEPEHSRESRTPEELYAKLAKAGLREKAEYLVTYNINPLKGEDTGTFLKTWVMISAKIIDTANGRVVANQNRKVLGVDKNSEGYSYMKAGRKAGLLVAKYLEEKLIRKWEADTVTGRPVTLKLLKVRDFSLLMEFKEKLKKTFGVKKIFQRNSSGTTIQYEVSYVGDTDTLKENIAHILKRIGVKTRMPATAGDSISVDFSPTKRGKK